jgi:putative addiction module component (TIGR02574 family)
MTTKELLEAALDLEPRERERLVEQIMESLVSDKEFASDEIERAWLGELQRRSAEIDAGTADLVNWTDVRSRIAARRAPH